VAYAVELAPAARAEALDSPRELISAFLGVGGMVTTPAAMGAWRGGTEVGLTAGAVGVLLLVLIGTVLSVRHADRLLRAVVRR
jgi:hypothetical protein